MARNLIVIFQVFLLFAMGTCAAAQSNRLVDPLRPLRGTPGGGTTEKKEQTVQKSLHLTAVLISKQRSVAVINGESLQRGETIDGYKVVDIRSDRVELLGKGGKRILQRAGTGLKKLSTKSEAMKGSKL